MKSTRSCRSLELFTLLGIATGLGIQVSCQDVGSVVEAKTSNKAKATHGCVAQHLRKAGVGSASASKYEALFAKMEVSPSYVRQTPAPVFTILMGASRNEAKKITDCFQRTAAASASCKKGLVAGVGCNGRGVCRDLKSSEPFYQCVCRPPYRGVLCETAPNHCKPRNPCANGGVCVTHAKGFTCRCRTGYSGKKCQDKWMSQKSFGKKLAKYRQGVLNVLNSKIEKLKTGADAVLLRTPTLKLYRRFLQPARFKTAQAICKKFGMRLALPETKSEDAHLRQLCRSLKTQYCWIGISDISHEGKWVGEDGGTPKYFNWESRIWRTRSGWRYYTHHKFQPNGGITENCGLLNGQTSQYGSWHDGECNTANGVICQMESLSKSNSKTQLL